MDQDKNTQISQQAVESGKNTIKQAGGMAAKKLGKKAKESVGKGIKSAGKAAAKVGKKAAVEFAKAIVKLVTALGPWALVLVGVILLGAFAYSFLFEERGTSTSLDLDPANENPTVMSDTGHVKAVAMTQTQALIDAYYKYLACDSHRKLYVDEAGVEHWLQFSNVDQTADFAGLVDAAQKENYFYLSPYFIKMTDELLNNEEFYYPEQVIKPVFSAVLPLKNPESGEEGKKYITTLPLVDDASDNAKVLRERSSPEIDALDGLYASAVETAITSANGQPPEREADPDATNMLLAPSQPYAAITEADGAIKLVRDEAADAVSGVWDYGFGSVLQYEPMEKNVTMEVTKLEISYHFHLSHWEMVPSLPDDPDSEKVKSVTSTECRDGTYEVPAGATASSIKSAITEAVNAYASDDTDTGVDATVAVMPTDAQLTYICSHMGNVPLRILPEDEAMASTYFSDPALREAFGNADGSTYEGAVKATHYPLKVPVIVAAATFSGNLRYKYDLESLSRDLTMQTGTEATLEESWETDCTEITVATGTCSSGTVSSTITRAGTITTTGPSGVPTEYSDPIGFQYTEAYGSHYQVYVPDQVQNDLDFRERVSAEQPGADALSASEKGKYDADQDGRVTTMDLLIKLGLLTPYAGGQLGPVGNLEQGTISAELEQAMAAMGCSTDEEGQVRLLAKVIAAESGPNKLDQLLVGAVVVNRVCSEEFPDADSIIEVISAEGAYSTWSSGRIQSAEPTEEMLASARQVISGEFAIPANIVFQAGFTQGSTVWLTNVNGAGYNTHYYCCNGDAAGTDIFGRTALTAEQVKATAENLHQQDAAAGISASVPSNIATAGDQSSLVLSQAYLDQPLYSIQGFDIQFALANMRQISSRDSIGFLEGLVITVGNAIADILDQISSFFTAMNIFYQKGDSNLEYIRPVALLDMHNTVIQAITFSEQAGYDSISKQFDPNARIFLFVGQEGWGGAMQGTIFGFGGGMIPGTGSTLTGYISPTTTHYNVSSPWSSATGFAIYAIPEGTPLVSVGDMTVISVVEDNGAYKVTLQGEADSQTIQISYANMTEANVTSGQAVSKGTTIGAAGVGGTPISLLVNGVNTDPAQYFYQPTYGAGVSFFNVLDANGEFDQTLIDELGRQLNAANQKGGPYDQWHAGAGNIGQCAWWAKGRGKQYVTTFNKIPSNGFKGSYGNGRDFYANGGKQWKADKFASANSWISWWDSTYGHVAFVEAVDKHGSILISHTGPSIWENATRGEGIQMKVIKNTGTATNPSYICYRGQTFTGFVHLDQPIA